MVVFLSLVFSIILYMGMEYFATKLKAVRKSHNLTQAELAKKLNVSVGIIAAYEQGKTYPRVDVLIRICNLLDTSSDYLLGLSDDLPLKTSGLTDEEMQPFLQLLALVTQNREK
ncbi:helix-turn-helix domain-containing protein [Lactococcus lactis]